MRTQHHTEGANLQPPTEHVDPSSNSQLHEQVASPAVTPEKDCVRKLQSQIEDMKRLKADNRKGHTERMDAMAASNLTQKEARKAEYKAESEAQNHYTENSKTANAKKVTDLRSANQSKMITQRGVNEAEVIEMRRQNGQSSDEHDAWMQRLRTENKAKMAQMESDGAWKLSAIKQRGRRDKQRHQKEFAESEATHNADMAAIEEKYQTDLKAARQSREKNLTRHNRRMAEQSVQHKHETAKMELRQRNEVSAFGRSNEAKAETEASDLKELKGKNQSKMDDMCRLMRRSDDLEAQLEASTERFFVLADKVESEKALMRTYDELTRLTGTLLTAQLKIIHSLRDELADVGKNYEATLISKDDEEAGTLKALTKQFEAIIDEQDRVRRRVSREIDAFDKINRKLLEAHDRVLAMSGF